MMFHVLAVEAINNAMDTAYLPAILEVVPGGFDGVEFKAKICTPNPVSALQGPLVNLLIASSSRMPTVM